MYSALPAAVKVIGYALCRIGAGYVFRCERAFRVSQFSDLIYIG